MQRLPRFDASTTLREAQGNLSTRASVSLRARTLCSALPLDGKNEESLAGIAPTEGSTVKPWFANADQISTASG